eukprot:gene28338-34214_t
MKALKKKDSIMKKQNPQFTQKLLDNSFEPGAVEMKNKQVAQQRPSFSKPSATDGRSGDMSDVQFLPEEGYRWDFCIQLANPDFDPNDTSDNPMNKAKPRDEEAWKNYEEIMERLFLGGLQTYSYFSGDGDEIFIKVRASLERLRQHASLVGMTMRMDPEYLRKFVDNRRQPIQDNAEITSLPPYQYIYAPYEYDKHVMFSRVEGYSHPFSSIIRIKLLMDIIDSDHATCCSLKLRTMATDGRIMSFFPLHDYDKRDELMRVWLNWKVQPWEQPLDEVKDYLGEKVALYFEFTAHYTTWLLPLSIGGVIVAINIAIETGLSDGDIDDALLTAYTIPFYCIFVSFWSQLMIEYWKRKEARRAMEWGTSNFEAVETERPEFQGEERFSYIDGKPMKYYPPADKAKKVMYSCLVIFGMILLVLCCVSVIFYLQYLVNENVDDDSNKSSGNTAVSLASAIQIMILNSIYSGIAITLTDGENHRTDTEYDDSLIGKLFAFSFINSYASLFFVAYIKSTLGEACRGACMAELAYQLAVIFGTKLTVDKISTYLTMVVNKGLKERAEEKEYEEARRLNRVVHKPSKAERQSALEEYKPSLGVLEDYAQVFIQFGFVTLFVAACPVAPMLAYIANYIEIRSDGYKLMKFMRRVVPTGAQDIGTWLVILQMTALISVGTNAALLCFTMDLLSWSGVAKVWLFIGFQYFIITAMALFAYLVDDVPIEVTTQLARQEYLVERAEMSEQEREEADKKSGQGMPEHRAFDINKFKPREVDDEPAP